VGQSVSFLVSKTLS